MIFEHPIYPITDTALSGKSHAEQVLLLVDSGVSLVQLREKHKKTDEFYLDAKKALEIGRDAGIKIIINDRVDIALALGADGVHLGQTDLPPNDARKLLGNKAIIGFSTHDFEQAREACDFTIDYLAFGPVFETETKENPEPVTGIGELRAVVDLCNRIPVVAIGGIGLENINLVRETGVASCALISAVFSSDRDAHSRISALNEKWLNKNV